MASGSITSWQIDGETVETVRDFIFLGSKITEDGDCNHEIKRCLLLGRKAMTNLDSILKSRGITLLTAVHLDKLWFFQWSCLDVSAQSLQLYLTLCDPMDCRPVLCPWNSPGKNTGVGCHFLLQEIFPTQELNPGLSHCRQTLH